MRMAAPNFGLEVSQNRYLSIADTEMDAILTVTARDIAVSGSAAAEVILLDCSGSMFMPSTKIAAAQQAAAAAVDVLRDGAFFAIVKGTDHAEMCYPTTLQMAVANAETKAEAKRCIGRMTASGGTRMGTWLTCARDLFAAHRAAIRHAVLLTDGQNQHETPEELDRALAACEGHFSCDARGIGDDWDPRELRRIVTKLRGTADSVRTASELVDDFRALVVAAMEKVVPDLRIRVTTMRGAELRLLKQVYPRELDLTGNPARQPETENGGIVWEFSTGSWAANDTRDYQLSLRMDRGARDPMDEDLRAATIELVARPDTGDTAAPAERCAPLQSVLVHWTTDPPLAASLDPKVAHYNAQAELHKATFAGFDAYDGGRLRAAARAWGKAVQLATEFGNTELLTRLKRLVAPIDAVNGIVRIKQDLSREDLLNAAVGSTISSRFPGEPRRRRFAPSDGDSRPAKPDVTCTSCGRILPGIARFCGECGTRLGEQSR
jgi:hypothetical protein